MVHFTRWRQARGVALGVLACALAVGCGGESSEPPAEAAYDWGLPAWAPTPRVPEDNPMSARKVELGRRLFYDVRLSGNQTQSCASCHDQTLAFTDGLARAEGSTGEAHPRGAMSLANVAYSSTLTWANPLMTQLEEQALVPMFGEEPVELGLSGKEAELITRLEADARYPALFAAAFPEDAAPVSLQNITRAIASFQRALISLDSPFDRHVYGGQRDAMSEAAKRGMDLFFSERLECFHCHGGLTLSDAVDHEGKAFVEKPFHNNGLYNVGGTGAYPTGNQGVYEITGMRSDEGRFKAPTLRNIAVTAPYMHDGSLKTLDDVIDHYARGGTLTTQGQWIGDGRLSPNKSELLNGFLITDDERADLKAFLESLTDETFLNDPRFGDPFKAEAAR